MKNANFSWTRGKCWQRSLISILYVIAPRRRITRRFHVLSTRWRCKWNDFLERSLYLSIRWRYWTIVMIRMYLVCFYIRIPMLDTPILYIYVCIKCFLTVPPNMVEIGSVLHKDEGGIGKSSGRGDGFPNNSRVLVEDRHSLPLYAGSGSRNPSL